MNDLVRKPKQNAKLKTNNLNMYYGDFQALGGIEIDIPECAITAIIGSSGCGKSTLLRIFNRMNDLIRGVRVEGKVLLDDLPIYGNGMDVVMLRQKVGMVFQKPNVFPMSIFDNIVMGPRNHGTKRQSELNDIVERCLSQVAMWDEVKDELKNPGLDLSAGDQQRLCIARALAVEPEVILFDESCSALDPESTMKIEELMLELARKYTILIVTHNMEQARRISDWSLFLMIDDNKVGRVVEYAPTEEMFENPRDSLTEAYITGRFG